MTSIASVPPSDGVVADQTTDASRQEREARLLGGLPTLRGRVGQLVDGERLLFLIGAAFVALGFFAIVIAYSGVANSGLVFEQLPYVVSGGLGGLAFVVLGGFMYFAWWQTRAIHESRAQHQELMQQHQALLESQQQLLEVLAQRSGAPAPARRPRQLVADTGADGDA